MLERIVARDPHRRWFTGLARPRALVRVVLLTAGLAILLAVADARLRPRPLPGTDLGTLAGYVVDGVRDLPGVDLTLLPAAVGRDQSLVAQCLFACVLALALARSLKQAWDLMVAYRVTRADRIGFVTTCARLERALVRVVLLTAGLAILLAVADARLRPRPLPGTDLGTLTGYVVDGVRDLPGVDLTLLSAAVGRDQLLVVQCLLACVLAAVLIRALVYACELCVALVIAGALTLVYLALFAVAVAVSTPVVLVVAAVRMVAYRRWVVPVERFGVTLERMPGHLVAVAAALLPGPYRERYAEEFSVELHDLAHEGARWRHLLSYSLRILIRAGRLHAELRSSSREKASS
ncbi:hypothetical protein [Nonomuraea aurantiaca]|uniref:hypothetical protein n=1 Tax=Nonomuraea aurantiaca TaxID=2878562 RepID=UPI001CD9914F|nr:hypothetical protein [Nonomuraea aurantiaca]MCA2228601.1 hypothetical protein [Nonomuraea aurantiaca]